ncbi:Ras GTPase activating protein ira2 [Malassezia nana]|uniref:Ras GTPase activating protein ira2 n=1 Tax=Malassezia nana TaxID=180528 RepID=A0AAF0ELT5_9BASI|nr:Ras GTPase activating protein ira2 [Malassezia nana]
MGVLFEYVRQERDTILNEFALVLEDMELPGSLDLPDSRIQLYRALCMVRILSSCVSHEWKAYLPDEEVTEPRLAWPNPSPLEDVTVRHLLRNLVRFAETLYMYEQTVIDMHVEVEGRNSPDPERSRALSFLPPREQETIVRGRDMFVSMMDSCRGLHAGCIHHENFHVILPYFPPQQPCVRPKECGGVVFEPEGWFTPADGLDVTPIVLAAHLSRELSPVLLYLSSCNWETTRQGCGSELDPCLDLRLYESLHWRWPQLQRFLFNLAARLTHLPRRVLCQVSVVVRRMLIKWSLWHPEEREQVCANGPPEAAIALFDALFTVFDSPRRRIVLWPTLCALSGLSPHIHMPSRTRRDAGTKTAQLLDAIIHNLSTSRNYSIALFSLALMFEMGSLGNKSLPEALIQFFFQRICDLLPILRENEPRAAALFLASLVRSRYTRQVADMLQTAIQTRMCHQCVLLISHTLTLLSSYQLDESWKDILYPVCAPALRRSMRTIVSSWLVRRDITELSLTTAQAIMTNAVVDPESLLTALPPLPSGEPSWPLSLSGQQLDVALQEDSVTALVLAHVHLPTSLLMTHCMTMCSLKRLSGGVPPKALMVRFVYTSPDMLRSPKNPLPVYEKVLQILLPYDQEHAQRDTQCLFNADTHGSQRYWLTSIYVSLMRMIRAKQVALPPDGPSAVLFGLCSSNSAVVAAARELGLLLAEYTKLPVPFPALLERMPDQSKLCDILRSVPAPNETVRTMYQALFRLWKTLLPRHPCSTALAKELRHMTRVLSASLHVALYDVKLTEDEQLLCTVSELMLEPVHHHHALRLLASVPTAGLVPILELVYRGSSSEAAIAVWLPTLSAIVPRLKETCAPSPILVMIMDMVAACVRNVVNDKDRCELCRIVTVLATFEAKEVDKMRFELVDGMLPWALLSMRLRHEVLTCMVPLTTRLRPHIGLLVERMDTSLECALHRRTARAVDRLLRAGTFQDKQLPLDVVQDSETHMATQALSQVFEQNPDFLRSEAVSLTGTPLVATRCMVLRAMAQVLNSPTFHAVELESVHARPSVADLLCKEQGRWVARKLAQAPTNDVAEWERALSGVLFPHQLHVVLRSLFTIEVQQCQDEHLLMRTNSSALLFLSAYARRASYVQLQVLVQRLVAEAELVPDQALLTDVQGAESAAVARHRETAVRLIQILRKSLVTFIQLLPAELHQLFVIMKEVLTARFGPASATRALLACLCLRVIGPAIAAPSMVGASAPAPDAGHRPLLFLNKVLVALPQKGFHSHRDPALTQLNAVVAETSSELDRVLHDTCNRFVADLPDLSVTRTLSLVTGRALYALLRPMAEQGDAFAKKVLDCLPSMRSLQERVALIMDGRDRASVYEDFMTTYRESDTRVASTIFYELPRESRSAFCLAYTRMDMVRADLIGLVHYVVRTLSMQLTPWDLVLDLTGATERQMLQSQLTAFIVELLPEPVFQQLTQVYVMNAGSVLLRHSWSFADVPQQNPFSQRRQAEGGPPVRITWVTTRAEAHDLSDRQLSALSPVSQRVLNAKHSYIQTNLHIDDMLRPPVPAVLTVMGDVLAIRSTSRSSDSSFPDVHTCDVFPLVDAVFSTDQVSKIALLRRSCADELYLHSSDCLSLVQDLRCMQMALSMPSTSVSRTVPLTQVRATYIGMALFYRSSPHMPLRAAADTLLRATGMVRTLHPTVYMSPLFDMPPIPAALREGVLRSLLDIAGSHGRVNLLSSRLDELVQSVPPTQLRSMWRHLLSVWMLHPEHRSALQSAFNSLRSSSASGIEALGYACLDLMSSSQSICADSIQDAVIVAALPELHGFFVTHTFSTLTAPPMPNRRHVLGSLLALQAVQCLVPQTPLSRFLPEILALFLLFAFEPDKLLHELANNMLVHAVACWTGYQSPDLRVHDPFHGETPSVQELVQYAYQVLYALSPNADVERQWRSMLEARIRSVALTPNAPAQVRALDVLGQISAPSSDYMHSVSVALLAAYPHTPEVVNACATCLARLFVPDQAAALFWVGLLLVASGAFEGGVLLADSTLRAMPPTQDVFKTLLDARQAQGWDAQAMDRVLGVSFHRDFSFACASVLRLPLWDTDAQLQKETRDLIELLIELSAPCSSNAASPGPMALSLLLYCSDPNESTRELLQSSVSHNAELPPAESVPNSVMCAALAQSLLAQANDQQLQTLLPLTIEHEWMPDSSCSETSSRSSEERPLLQLGFSGLKWKPDSDTLATECRQWLQDLVHHLAPAPS